MESAQILDDVARQGVCILMQEDELLTIEYSATCQHYNYRVVMQVSTRVACSQDMAERWDLLPELCNVVLLQN